MELNRISLITNKCHRFEN